MKYFAPLSIKDCLLLLGVFVLGYIWLHIDQLFISDITLRFAALIILLFVLFFGLLSISKPDNVLQFVNSITIVALTFIILISLVMHALFYNNFNYKTIIIWIIAAGLPYLAGFVYKITLKKNIP